MADEWYGGLLFVALSFVASGMNVEPPPYNCDPTSFALWLNATGDWFRVRTGAFSRWLGWIGATAGLAAVLGCAALAENGPAGVSATISDLGGSHTFCGSSWCQLPRFARATCGLKRAR